MDERVELEELVVKWGRLAKRWQTIGDKAKKKNRSDHYVGFCYGGASQLRGCQSALMNVLWKEDEEVVEAIGEEE